jgi:hypothetical protein
VYVGGFSGFSDSVSYHAAVQQLGLATLPTASSRGAQVYSPTSAFIRSYSSAHAHGHYYFSIDRSLLFSSQVYPEPQHVSTPVFTVLTCVLSATGMPPGTSDITCPPMMVDGQGSIARCYTIVVCTSYTRFIDTVYGRDYL